MKTATVKIKGTRPHWFHRLPIEDFGKKRKERSGTAGNDPKEWRKTYRATEEGQLFLPPEMIFSCLRNAAKHTKSGRGSIMKKVAATLQVVDNKVLLDRFMPKNGDDPKHNAFDEGVYIDVRGVRNPSTRGANIRYRVACKEGWLAEFRISWDETIVSEPEMEQVCLDAGALEGLGNGRSIGMGRFEVESFSVKK